MLIKGHFKTQINIALTGFYSFNDSIEKGHHFILKRAQGRHDLGIRRLESRWLEPRLVKPGLLEPGAATVGATTGGAGTFGARPGGITPVPRKIMPEGQVS